MLKQALPYVRLIGPEWPFTPRRAVAEARAYREHGRFAPELIPALYGFDPERYILAVEDLSDHRVWRTALTDGERHDQAAEKMGRYVGRLAFHTSVFGVEAKALKLLAAEAVSPELCEITEDLVLTEPFSGAERNWFQEEIRPAAERLQAPAIRAAAAEAKHAFMTRGEALIHGDLHTGSVMVREDGSTRAFDGEFCFYGPVGFDLGLLWANFIVTLARDHALGRDRARPLGGDAAGRGVGRLRGRAARAVARAGRRARLPRRVPGRAGSTACAATRSRFAAAEAARRVVGLAHVADLESLELRRARRRVARRASRPWSGCCSSATRSAARRRSPRWPARRSRGRHDRATCARPSPGPATRSRSSTRRGCRPRSSCCA